MTNLVDRPTAEQNELSVGEMREAVLPFTRKLVANRPLVVCFVGKKIWDIFESVAGRTARTRRKEEEKALSAGKRREAVEERAREREREKVRRDVARQEAKSGSGGGGVVAFTLVNGDVVKLDSAAEEVKEEEVEEGARKAGAPAGAREDDDEPPLVSIDDLSPSTPTKSPYFRVVPHSPFAFDQPQRLRLVLPPAVSQGTPSKASGPETATAGVSTAKSTSSATPSKPPGEATPTHHSSSSSLSSPPSDPAASEAAPAPAPQPSAKPAPGEWRHTYFWVVPNTSGLERTPLARQGELFGRLRAFVASLEEGVEPEGEFVDFTLEDVQAAGAESPRRSTPRR